MYGSSQAEIIEQADKEIHDLFLKRIWLIALMLKI